VFVFHSPSCPYAMSAIALDIGFRLWRLGVLRSKLGRRRILCTAMNACWRVKPAMRLAVAIIVLLRCARNTSVLWTIRLLTSVPWSER
jgi:hypothetical protein